MNKEFIASINFFDGIIIYNRFDIDENIPFDDQWYSYNEDILQIKFGDRFILDVGWYPEDDPNGNFIILAIQDQDWMNSISRIECKTLNDLKIAIEKTIQIILEQRKIKDLPYRDNEYRSH